MESAMARVEVSGGSGDGSLLKWRDIEPGTTLEGAWIGSTAGEYGPIGELILTADQRKVKFPMPAALEERLGKVHEGAVLTIQYCGLRKTKSGREFHAFKVFADERDLLDGNGTDRVPF